MKILNMEMFVYDYLSEEKRLKSIPEYLFVSIYL